MHKITIQNNFNKKIRKKILQPILNFYFFCHFISFFYAKYFCYLRIERGHYEFSDKLKKISLAKKVKLFNNKLLYDCHIT
jgi:hypothetical protein